MASSWYILHCMSDKISVDRFTGLSSVVPNLGCNLRTFCAIYCYQEVDFLFWSHFRETSILALGGWYNYDHGHVNSHEHVPDEGENTSSGLGMLSSIRKRPILSVNISDGKQQWQQPKTVFYHIGRLRPWRCSRGSRFRVDALCVVGIARVAYCTSKRVSHLGIKNWIL